MTAATYIDSRFASTDMPAKVTSFDRQKSEVMARLQARKTTFTAENIEMFNDNSTPEVSGDLRKRFVFF